MKIDFRGRRLGQCGALHEKDRLPVAIGRKRHIVVDTPGNLLSAVVRAADIHDTVSDIFPAPKALQKHPSRRRFCGDEGSRKTFCEAVSNRLGLGVDISERIKPVFGVIPKRSVVERTFSWLNASRRLSKDYEITTSSEESFIMTSHMHTLLRRGQSHE